MLLGHSQVEAFRGRHSLDQRVALSLLATAEHLRPRSEGGGHSVGNIAAAHAVCNHRRHRSEGVRSPDAYREHVQRCCASGNWIPQRLQRLLVREQLDDA